MKYGCNQYICAAAYADVAQKALAIGLEKLSRIAYVGVGNEFFEVVVAFPTAATLQQHGVVRLPYYFAQRLQR